MREVLLGHPVLIENSLANQWRGKRINKGVHRNIIDTEEEESVREGPRKERQNTLRRDCLPLVTTESE